MFFHHDRGNPVRGEEWPAVIRSLYEKLVGVETDIPVNAVKMVHISSVMSNGR
jgi:hypothetical protein